MLSIHQKQLDLKYSLLTYFKELPSELRALTPHFYHAIEVEDIVSDHYRIVEKVTSDSVLTATYCIDQQEGIQHRVSIVSDISFAVYGLDDLYKLYCTIESLKAFKQYPKWVKGSELSEAAAREVLSMFVHRHTRECPNPLYVKDVPYIYDTDEEWLDDKWFPITSKGLFDHRYGGCQSRDPNPVKYRGFFE